MIKLKSILEGLDPSVVLVQKDHSYEIKSGKPLDTYVLPHNVPSRDNNNGIHLKKGETITVVNLGDHYAVIRRQDGKLYDAEYQGLNRCLGLGDYRGLKPGTVVK